jgi:type IV pilus assembly protein PilW
MYSQCYIQQKSNRIHIPSMKLKHIHSNLLISNKTTLAARAKVKSFQTGVTLVELMVAMAISLFLLIAIGLVYSSSKAGFSYANNTVRMSEDGTFALDSMSRDIRMAAYGGCAGTKFVDNPLLVGTKSTPKLFNATSPQFDYSVTNPAPNPFSGLALAASNAVQGFKGDDTASSTARTAMGIDSSTSFTASTTMPMLYVSGGSEKALQVSAGTATGAAAITFPGDPLKWENDNTLAFRIISDCKNSEVFRSTSMNAAGSMATDKPLLNGYDADAVVTTLISSTYFLAKRNGATTSSLYRQYFNGWKRVNEELVPNVEAITFQYGLSTSCIGGVGPPCTAANPPAFVADKYVKDTDADFATMDWSRVVSIRMGLIMVTEDNGQTAKASTTTDEIDWIKGKYVVPTADRRLRRAYSTTVTIRNRSGL